MNKLKMGKIRHLFQWNTSLVLIVIFEVIVFGAINPRFLRLQTLLGSFNDFAAISIIALFETFVVITGNIDISVGSIVGLVSTVIGVSWKAGHFSIGAAVALGLLVGLLCGLLNGFLIAFTDVQSMVVTLGSMLLYSGIALVIAGASGTSASEGISGLPQAFVGLANSSVGILPNLVILFLVLSVLAYILLHRTKFGKQVFLVGINKHTAKYSGLNSRLIVLITYLLADVGAAFAGVVQTSYIGGSRPDIGSTALNSILAAVFLGGTAMTGGKGGITGTAIASIVVALLSFGLQMAGVQSQYVTVGIGLVLIVSVMIRGATDENSIIYKTVWKIRKNRRNRLSTDVTSD